VILKSAKGLENLERVKTEIQIMPYAGRPRCEDFYKI